MSTQTLTAGTAPTTPPWTAMLAFHADAAFNFVLGLELVVFAGWFAALILPENPQIFGISTTMLLRVLGAVLVLFAVDTFIAARSRGRFRKFLPAVVVTNWVAGVACLGVALLAAPMLSTAGMVIFAGLGLLGFVVAVAQQRTLKVAALQAR